MHEKINITIRGLTEDSRKVEKGFLFAALKGAKTDGTKFIDKAIEKGAVAVLAAEGTEIHNKDVCLITDKNPRKKLALMSSCFYGKQPENITAVTGTNGKSSVCDFSRQIFELLGKKAASIGTLGVKAEGFTAKEGLTTPDSITLHATLKKLAETKIDYVAMEASSHGLEQYRLDGVDVSVAAFTNLSQDHLDYHSDMESYFKAKTRLFTDFMDNGYAVLNSDIPEFEELEKICTEAGHTVIDYGRKARKIKIIEQTPSAEGQTLVLNISGNEYKTELPLAGTFQAYNAACAVGIAIANGFDTAETIEALPHLKGVDGRIERVSTLTNGAEIYVDYAHTPDALETVLKALKTRVKNRLCVVFGCGGDRDKTKRPIMGKIAEKLCDMAIVTDDNPRSEQPSQIRKEILVACPDATEIGDRAEAIKKAISELETGDILVVAGKGHETGQKIGDKILPFDDREQIKKAVKLLNE